MDFYKMDFDEYVDAFSLWLIPFSLSKIYVDPLSFHSIWGNDKLMDPSMPLFDIVVISYEQLD